MIPTENSILFSFVLILKVRKPAIEGSPNDISRTSSLADGMDLMGEESALPVVTDVLQ